jgi:DNA ligase-associated metallophosphoesterase
VQKAELDIELAGQHFTLLPEKAVYWKEHKILLIADVHAGKASHFRTNGIPLSTDPLLNDLNIVLKVIKRLNPAKLIFLGDLYHTHFNIENELIDSWLGDLDIDVELILGNHDRHSFLRSKLRCKEAYTLDGILLCHEPAQSDIVHICGHLHPAYSLSGKARQHIKMPAYYLSTTQLILPAFGSVNGGKMYKDIVKKSDVILVSDDGLIRVWKKYSI